MILLRAIGVCIPRAGGASRTRLISGPCWRSGRAHCRFRRRLLSRGGKGIQGQHGDQKAGLYYYLKRITDLWYPSRTASSQKEVSQNKRLTILLTGHHVAPFQSAQLHYRRLAITCTAAQPFPLLSHRQKLSPIFYTSGLRVPNHGSTRRILQPPSRTSQHDIQLLPLPRSPPNIRIEPRTPSRASLV